MPYRLAPTVAALTAGLAAGLTITMALRRRAEEPLAAPVSAPTAGSVPAAGPAPAAVPEPVAALLARDGVVLPFVRPVPAAAPSLRPAEPARCGDNGGQTKAGAPCGARASTAGRCRHHQIAA